MSEDSLQDLQALTRRISDIYAERFGVERDATWYLGKMTEELGEVTAAWLKLNGQGCGEGSREALTEELADLLGFVLLFADWQGIDPGAALRRKWGKYLDAPDGA